MRRMCGSLAVVAWAGFAATAAWAQQVQQPPRYEVEKGTLEAAYLITTSTTLHETWSSTSAVVTKARPLDLVFVGKVVAPWVCGQLARPVNDPKEDPRPIGCVRGVPENVCPRDFLETYVVLAKMKDTAWPVATKLAIALGRVRVGFTPKQVELALGKSLGAVSEETAGGTTEVWTYLTQVVTFTQGRVSKIVRQKQDRAGLARSAPPPPPAQTSVTFKKAQRAKVRQARDGLQYLAGGVVPDNRDGGRQ